MFRGSALGRLVFACEAALRKSFEQRPVNGDPTEAEKKHRANLAIEIARQLRGDLGWSVDKIADKLPEYLLNELDGVNWKPDQRQIWTP